jgi:hypothetical protein
LCETLSKKQTSSKRTGGGAQGVEHLLNKCEALSSIPSTAKKKKKIRRFTAFSENLKYSVPLGSSVHMVKICWAELMN